MADYDLALGIKPPQIDVATPLLTAAKIRAADLEAQKHAVEMQYLPAFQQAQLRQLGLSSDVKQQELEQSPLKLEAELRQKNITSTAAEDEHRAGQIGQVLRGIAPYADKPEFQTKADEAHQELLDKKLITPQQFAAYKNGGPYSPLTLQGALARTQTAEQALKERAENKPVSVSAGSDLVRPLTGEVVHKGDSGMTPEAIEVGARQLIKGDLSGLTNLGKGAQGDQKLTALRNKAAQILINEHSMTPDAAAEHLSQKLQEFKAAGVGKGAEARTAGVREANLNLILKATEAAIPAALEASDKVARTGWVPINKIIQGGQVIASSPELKEFGMANLQLAEHWARAMNPTGVMRESDRDMALHFLSTADSKETYKRAVMQLKTQITRERDAVNSQRTGGAAAPAAPGATPLTTPAAGGTVPPPPPGFNLVP